MSTEIQRFIDQFKKTFVYEMLSQTLTDEQLFSHSIKDDGVIWFKEQMRQMWAIWLAGKVVPESNLNYSISIKSIIEHVDSHIAAIQENDLFDRGWSAAMRCVRHNIERLGLGELGDE